MLIQDGRGYNIGTTTGQLAAGSYFAAYKVLVRLS